MKSDFKKFRPQWNVMMYGTVKFAAGIQFYKKYGLWTLVFFMKSKLNTLHKGPFQYCVIKEEVGGVAKWWCLMTKWVGGGGYMLMWSKNIQGKNFVWAEKKVGIFLKNPFFMQCPSSVSKLTWNLFILSRISLISLIQVTDLFFWKNEPELVCSISFSNKNKPCLILALFIEERKKNL